ncbi:zinc finger protein 469 [Sardina pilchardus]|uniref:zinc finger protein 469 n=1 Tax=Sardina pilchardus TaxID=27697 RepID=UPI002E145DCE
MAGEIKRTYGTKELDAGSKKLEEGSTREQYGEKRVRGSPEHYSNGTVKFLDKDRESTQQREAVIRPQQAGKIDFKSLQNRPKFTSDSRPWPGGKGSPQSPSGKSRNRDKGKKSSKSDRGNPQQLYRLSITNPRSNNPTIGIAYPQQKVPPPKKLEASRGPVSGSYRFHVPSIPEREAELQQEERSYSRCFPEGPSNLTSSSYTSQVVMLFSDFQLNGTDAWQSPERTLAGAAYGITAQKANIGVEPNKAGFMPMSYQYGFPLLEDSATDAFSCDQNPPSQDYMDASLASSGQVPHNPFAFQASADGQEAGQGGSGQFGGEQSDDRPPYTLPSQPQQYLQIPHGPPSSMHCTRGMGEDTGLGESSGPSSEQGKAGMVDKTDGAAGKRNCHPKDGGATAAAANQRVLIQNNVHHIRNIAQGPGSQMHFPGKAYGSPPLNAVHMGPVPHDKNMGKSHSRASQPWEGQNKAFPPMEQNSLAYSSLPEKYPFPCQPAHDQRQGPGKNSRMTWQQIRSAMPNQNRIELSRQLSNQKLTFVIAPSEWQEEEKLHKAGPLKSPGSFQNKRLSEGYSNQRQESVKQTCSTGLPPCPYKSKAEASHVQACDAKNKSLYFGMNQSIPGASSRACNYPPMQVPPMGMMLVSPYESPLPSPTQNPASSSTCSSLSPASTSPVNSSSDDSQISKPVGPPPFYHQQQGKALTSTDHLNTNHHHFHADASRSLPYPTDRPKEDMMGFLQNNRAHPKSSMDSSKGCMDNFGMEHHPPPPYSAHQLLATSLATANLDQLDVLLTCKQCDQNFNNLVSFLEHKQYCGQHAFAQNDFKDISKVEDHKKFQMDPTKALTSGTGFSQMSRCPSDLHLSLLGLSKNGELIPDTEAKGDTKDDPLKLNLFSGGNHPPVSLPDLEMEDAKLDSLITEALNGLGYQSDNAEIDSSFIDAFVDDELTTAKCTSNRQTLKTKDCVLFESRTKHEATASERSYTQGKCPYDSDIDSHSTDSKQTESSNTESQSLEQSDDTNSKEESSPESLSVSSLDKSREHKQWMKETRKSETTLEESSGNPRFVLSKKFSERCGIKSVQESSLFVKSSVPQSPSGNRTSTTQRLVTREGKRKRTGGGTWSKELIHKIVQQKNKLHKLHVKGTKNMQFSLVMERLTPTVQTPTFREYDYVSDSDEDCEPLKIAGKGRLSQSIRCKYTYTKECKGRARSEKSRDLPWKQDKNDCFESKKADDVPLSPVKERLRRRSSRSSTSSELSTSVSLSSDSISSPKSTDRTDSDSERKVEVKRKDSDSFEQNGLERSPHRVRRESNTSLALSFSKNTKRYSTEKILLSANKEDSTTTTKCSSSSSRNTEIVSELTKTRSVFRFKSTEVSAVAKEDLFSCETGIMARTEESTCHTKESHKTCSSSKLYSSEVLSNKELNSNSKQKKDDSSSKVKSSHKRKDESVSDVALQHSDTPTIEFDKLTHGVHGDSKEPTNFQTDLEKKPPSLCNVLIDEVCLSPTNLQDVAVQKDSMRHSLMPCPLEQDQSLLKSPLSFDTSSMFGDLTVGAFDNNLYPDIQLNKDSFSPLESTSDKKEMFESSFSPFLEQRDWGLMVDVTPELPDEISQYKDDSDAESEKKNSFGAVPFSLPDKIMNYSTGLSNCVSEDELEIKRIVTELESQLQTNKLSASPLLEEELPKQLTMSKFSPLRLDQETDNEQSSLEVDCAGESLALTAPSLPADPHSEGFSEPEMPWASPLQFGLVETQHCLHTPTHSITHTHDTLNDKVGTGGDISVAERDDHPCTPHKSEGDSDVKSLHTDKSEEMLENEMYKENLMKSLENSASHTGQGNFQCEICSMYFRTLPGLKRHKAMKHVADPFPEELLSMLDTDILHSIPPEFPPVSQQGCCPFPEKTNATSSHEGSEVAGPENLTMETDINDHKFTTSPKDSFHIQKQDLVASDSDSLHSGLKPSDTPEEAGTSATNEGIVKDFEMSGEHELGQKSMNAELQEKTEVEIKSESSNDPRENTDPLNCSFKDPPASPSGLGPDLDSLLDDESTFSQLFPRTEEMKRKKCPRVYGKSNKKQKVASNVPAVQEYPPADMFLDRREDYKESKTDKMFVNNISAPEYDMMTIDDAIILDMCHKGVMKGSAEKDCHSDSMTKEKGCDETADHGANTFLCPTEDIISKVPVPLGPLNPVANTDPLVSPDVESCKSEHTDAYSGAPPCVQENASHFPSIDIQNLNTTFQLPEIQFFEPSKDISIVGSIISEDDVLQSLPTESEKPSKKPAERRGRKRGEAGLKPKDKQYKCKVCFTWFLTLGELNFHKLSHNPSPPPTCYMCVQRKFSSREQLRDHLREKHAKNKAGVWACGMCLKEISDVWMYNEHLREHATQFARKGQTQSSLLDMPGCFMQENAVKNFITSIMQHQPSKSTRGDKSLSREERRAMQDTAGQETKTDDDSEPIVTKTKSSGGGSKHSTFTPLEVLKAEIAPKNVEMHPNCKDPSRDCHHCGKQFPKPFKLQRHLVVHSLQKIFLCNKCPVSYQEAKDLKDHLKNEHEEVDESDSKHTTLYTCELCADVMHVIKKSFICSTCNYIFSKKEQFDRHMEKHLAGGNKIFKFRGVLRPCKMTTSKDDSFNSPPSKKRKILPESLQENSSDSGIASVASCHLGQSVELEALKSSMAEPMQCSDDNEHQTETSDTDVKTEDEIVEELKQCQFNVDSAVQTSPPKAIPKMEESDDLSHVEPAQETNNNGKNVKCMTVNCDVKEEDDPLASPKQLLSPISVAGDERDCTSKPNQCFSEANIHESLKEADHNKRGGESSPGSQDKSHAGDLSHKEPQSCSPKLTEQTREEKAKDHPVITAACDTEGKDPPSASGTDQFVSPQMKEKASSRAGENHKHSPGASPRALSSGNAEVSPVHHAKVTALTSSSNEEKESTRPQKKRKEPKVTYSSQKTSSTVARENLGIDSKVKKKFRLSKAELPSGLRKPEAPGDYPVLSSVKDDIVSNKIVSKHRSGTLGLQLKKGSLDNYPPKKTEIVRHLNVEFKGKRLGPGRPVQSPTSKVSVPSMNNSLNKSKPKAGVRSVDTHSYRTAESQNNLLSQLFGQKLTSFKIPLRKDTSESIN